MNQRTNRQRTNIPRTDAQRTDPERTDPRQTGTRRTADPRATGRQSAAAPARSRAGAIAALALGAALTIFGPIAGVLFGSFALVPSALGYAESTVRLAPTATVDLDAGESVLLLAPVAELEEADHGACTAEAVGGAAATISYEPASALNMNAQGGRYESFARVTADEAGAYTISCGTGVDAITAPPFELGAFFGPLGWWTAGGLLVSLIGIVLVIVGIVRLAARSPRAS